MEKEIINNVSKCAVAEFNLLKSRAERDWLLEGHALASIFAPRKERVVEQVLIENSLVGELRMSLTTKAVIPNASTVRVGPGYFRV